MMSCAPSPGQAHPSQPLAPRAVAGAPLWPETLLRVLTSASLVERIAVGFAEAEWLRRLEAPNSAVIDLDGFRMLFAGVPEPALNSVLVVREPSDVRETFDRSEAEFARRGLLFGIDVAVERHPRIDAEIRARGLTMIIKRTAMTVAVEAMGKPPIPDGVTIEVVAGKARMLEAAEAAGEAFGDPSAVVRGFYAHSVPAVPEAKCLVARDADGHVVGSAAAYLHEGAVGVLGLGVRPARQRKGIGASLTSIAARVFPEADLVWLHPSDIAVAMYGSLGFRPAGDWEVWIRR